MTQVTTIAETGDRVAVGPGWAMHAAGFLALFGGLALSLLLIFSGALAEGLFIALSTLLGIPFLALVTYTFWRFYWQILAVVLGLLVLALIIVWIGIDQGSISLPVRWSLLARTIKSSNIISVLMAIVLAALGAASGYRIYTLWQVGELGSLRGRFLSPSAPSEALFNFEVTGASSLSVANLPLWDRVMNHLLKTGHRGERQGDLIYVYKKRDFVGIVRVVESAGAISPIIVRDVDKQRAKLGVKVAYLATAGWFTDDVRLMADHMGVKLISV